MIREIRPALSLVVLFTIVLGVIFPVAITGLAQIVLPFQANGSLIQVSGKIVGSALIGQNFTAPIYFHGRPSALTGTDAKGKTIPTPYDASESGASNLAPTSKTLVANVAARVKAYRTAYGPGPVPPLPFHRLSPTEPSAAPPADAVESSGSGLDPDISLANAQRQAPAVAAARHIPQAMVTALVNRLAVHRFLGFIGTDHVNVLKLNLALDHQKA